MKGLSAKAIYLMVFAALTWPPSCYCVSKKRPPASGDSKDHHAVQDGAKLPPVPIQAGSKSFGGPSEGLAFILGIISSPNHRVSKDEILPTGQRAISILAKHRNGKEVDFNDTDPTLTLRTYTIKVPRKLQYLIPYALPNQQQQPPSLPFYPGFQSLPQLVPGEVTTWSQHYSFSPFGPAPTPQVQPPAVPATNSSELAATAASGAVTVVPDTTTAAPDATTTAKAEQVTVGASVLETKPEHEADNRTAIPATLPPQLRQPTLVEILSPPVVAQPSTFEVWNPGTTPSTTPSTEVSVSPTKAGRVVIPLPTTIASAPLQTTQAEGAVVEKVTDSSDTSPPVPVPIPTKSNNGALNPVPIPAPPSEDRPIAIASTGPSAPQVEIPGNTGLIPDAGEASNPATAVEKLPENNKSDIIAHVPIPIPPSENQPIASAPQVEIRGNTGLIPDSTAASKPAALVAEQVRENTSSYALTPVPIPAPPPPENQLREAAQPNPNAPQVEIPGNTGLLPGATTTSKPAAAVVELLPDNAVSHALTPVPIPAPPSESQPIAIEPPNPGAPQIPDNAGFLPDVTATPKPTGEVVEQLPVQASGAALAPVPLPIPLPEQSKSSVIAAAEAPPNQAGEASPIPSAPQIQVPGNTGLPPAQAGENAAASGAVATVEQVKDASDDKRVPVPLSIPPQPATKEIFISAVGQAGNSGAARKPSMVPSVAPSSSGPSAADEKDSMTALLTSMDRETGTVPPFSPALFPGLVPANSQPNVTELPLSDAPAQSPAPIEAPPSGLSSPQTSEPNQTASDNSAAPPATTPAAPVETPTVPVEAATAPVQGTATLEAPVETSAAPVETTVAPVETPAALVETTVAPVETPAAPVETPAAPVETAVAPVETPAALVETTVAPVETPAAPVETPAALVETTAVPVEAPKAPVETFVAPGEAPVAPVETPVAPVEAKPAQLQANDEDPFIRKKVPKAQDASTADGPVTV